MIRTFAWKNQKGLCEDCLSFAPMKTKQEVLDCHLVEEGQQEEGEVVECEGDFNNGFKEIVNGQ